MVNMFVILNILVVSSSTVFAQYHSFGRNKVQYTELVITEALAPTSEAITGKPAAIY